MLKYKIFGFIMAVAGAGVLLPSCNDKNSPGWEYMPDMYRSPHIRAYEPHDIFQDSLSAREPVKGAIPRGFLSYGDIPGTFEGYEQARASLTMPAVVPTDSVALASGAKLYGIYCSPCHGDKGAGQGILVQREKFLGVPSYADRDINEGTIFHVITYGRGVMGSHAAQVTPTERWLITQHVLKLRAELTDETADDEAADAGDTDDAANAEEGSGTEEGQENTENDTETTQG